MRYLVFVLSAVVVGGCAPSSQLPEHRLQIDGRAVAYQFAPLTNNTYRLVAWQPGVRFLPSRLEAESVMMRGAEAASEIVCDGDRVDVLELHGIEGRRWTVELTFRCVPTPDRARDDPAT